MNLSKSKSKLLSPRLTLFSLCRLHNGGLRIFVLTVVLLFATSTVMVLRVPSRSVFSFSSWRNVSVYQVLKMHLSGRPTHMTPLYECTRMMKPSINVSHLNLDLVKLYQDVPSKLKHLKPEDAWKRAFYPLLDKETKISLILLYAVFANALNEAGISHVVLHGTAMGAWRHHGMTPWDDDLDLAIDVAHWVEIRQALSCIRGYTLDVGSNSKWAFFQTDGHVIQGSNKRWPFLDLFLYTHDNEYAWALNYVHLRKFVFKMEDLFPTQLVPFECLMVPAPRHLRKVLEQQYVHPEICTSHYMDHRKGTADKEVISRPCTQLTDLYPMYFTNN